MLSSKGSSSAAFHSYVVYYVSIYMCICILLQQKLLNEMEWNVTAIVKICPHCSWFSLNCHAINVTMSSIVGMKIISKAFRLNSCIPMGKCMRKIIKFPRKTDNSIWAHLEWKLWCRLAWCKIYKQGNENDIDRYILLAISCKSLHLTVGMHII